ncbi:MAG: histidine kinase [Roseivivax sp.]|nr:histidine kinase [Roseivivax sp.]
MNGKLVGLIVLGVALLFGAVVYYTQVYYYYTELPESEAQVLLTPLDGAEPEPLAIAAFQGIDATSSPIRYRACFTTEETPQALAQRYAPYPGAVPRNAPGWFDCFDAAAIGAMIDSGEATVFTGQRNIEYGIDRVVAITSDGRGFVWEEINDCGDKAYDGTPLGDDCPPQE